MDDHNAMPNTTVAKKTRSNGGRHRIEIKKLKGESRRQVIFSQRRKRLFKKAKELSTLCGAEVGILALSNSGRVYATDDVDAVLDRHLAEPSEVEEHMNAARFWLDQPIDNLAPEKLVEYAMALKDLREKVADRLEELRIHDSSCSWPFIADQEVNKGEFGNQFMAER